MDIFLVPFQVLFLRNGVTNMMEATVRTAKDFKWWPTKFSAYAALSQVASRVRMFPLTLRLFNRFVCHTFAPCLPTDLSPVRLLGLALLPQRLHGHVPLRKYLPKNEPPEAFVLRRIVRFVRSCFKTSTTFDDWVLGFSPTK